MIKVLNISICKQNKQLNVLLNSALLPESFVSHLYPRKGGKRRREKTMGKRRKIRNNKHKDIIFELIYNQFALHYVACRIRVSREGSKCMGSRWCSRVREKGKICIQTCVSNFKPPFNLKFMTCITKRKKKAATISERKKTTEKKEVLNGMITNSNVVPGWTRAKKHHHRRAFNRLALAKACTLFTARKKEFMLRPFSYPISFPSLDCTMHEINKEKRKAGNEKKKSYAASSVCKMLKVWKI